jgi:hypothetical protein
MARLDRALVAVSGTLGQLANNSADRDHERIMAMRQENFMRLQHMLNEEGRAADRASAAVERQLDRTDRREALTEEMKGRRELIKEEGALRQTEAAADRSSRERIAGMEIGAQQERWNREDMRAFDQQYLSRTNAIDKRIQELNDYRVQAQAEGKLVDNSYLTQMDQELAQLTEQKRTLAQERDLTLMRSGDRRYAKMSPEDVEKARQEGRLPPEPGKGGGSGMPMAAQAPREGSSTGGTSIKIPQPPQKPAGMLAREERKGRPPERQAAAGGQELTLPSWESATNPPPAQQRRQIAVGEGARDLVQVGRDISGAIDARRNEGPLVKQVKASLEAGQRPSKEQIQALGRIDRDRLTQLFDFTEQQLQALGL